MAADPKYIDAMSKLIVGILVIVGPVVLLYMVLNNLLDIFKSKSKNGRKSSRNKRIEKCPLDGGVLVERSGKFGLFIGCSNFPQCHYTQKAIN